MLSDAVTRHIELRCALGFKYRVAASLLRSYARFAQACGDQVVQTHTVIQWALQVLARTLDCNSPAPGWWNRSPVSGVGRWHSLSGLGRGLPRSLTTG